MNLQQAQTKSLGEILSIAAMSRRVEIDTVLYHRLHGTVQTGPFMGMWLPSETVWGDGDLAPKLLGTYEMELHEIVTTILRKNYSKVINIGCAEGYYAVGYAKRLPLTEIIAFDTNQKAQHLCTMAAQKNGVADRVTVRDGCNLENLKSSLSHSERIFLMVDCEGAEKELLSMKDIPDLANCDFLVECHDFMDRSITKELHDRFQTSHHISIIKEGARDPNQHDILRALSGLDRWIAVCEFRPETMHWMMFWKRT